MSDKRCAQCDVISNTGERPRVYNTFLCGTKHLCSLNSRIHPRLQFGYKTYLIKSESCNHYFFHLFSFPTFFLPRFLFFAILELRERAWPCSRSGVYLRIRRRREYQAMAALRLVHSCSLLDLLSLLELSRRGGLSRSLWGNGERHRTNSVASRGVRFPCINGLRKLILSIIHLILGEDATFVSINHCNAFFQIRKL